MVVKSVTMSVVQRHPVNTILRCLILAAICTHCTITTRTQPPQTLSTTPHITFHLVTILSPHRPPNTIPPLTLVVTPHITIAIVTQLHITLVAIPRTTLVALQLSIPAAVLFRIHLAVTQHGNYPAVTTTLAATHKPRTQVVVIVTQGIAMNSSHTPSHRPLTLHTFQQSLQR